MILLTNSENWQDDYNLAVAYVTGLQNNVMWHTKNNAIFFVGSTRDVTMMAPATVDMRIEGDWPYAFAKALELQAKWNGGVITNVWQTPAGTNIYQDQLAIRCVYSVWGSLGA